MDKERRRKATNSDIMWPLRTGCEMVLQQYLRHLPHVGAQRERRLRQEGGVCWKGILNAEHPLAGLERSEWDEVCVACEQSLRAMEAEDVAFFTARIPMPDQWRVLAHWFGQLSYFDIETSGLEIDSKVTLISCFHRGEPLCFLADENMDDFLDLMEQIKVLVSFNGASFDVPRVLDRFHIQRLPCAHMDLRWLCHHAGWRGGLKKIEGALGLRRPPDLVGLGGAEAVGLWQAWAGQGDTQARRTLERYCVADTVMLSLLASRLVAHHGVTMAAPAEAELWRRVSAAYPDSGRSSAVKPPPSYDTFPRSPALRSPVVTADRFSIAEMMGEVRGLSRSEKQARLRERWRQRQKEGE